MQKPLSSLFTHATATHHSTWLKNNNIHHHLPPQTVQSLFNTNNWSCGICPTAKGSDLGWGGLLGFIRAKRGQTVRCEDTDGPYAGVGSVIAPLDSE